MDIDAVHQRAGDAGSVALHGADGDRPEAIVQGTGALAQAVLRADPAAYRGQRGLLLELPTRFNKFSLTDQLDETGDIDSHRATICTSSTPLAACRARCK